MFSLSKSASATLALIAACVAGNAMAVPVSISGMGTQTDQGGATSQEAKFAGMLVPGSATTESFLVGTGGFAEGQAPSPDLSVFGGAAKLTLPLGDTDYPTDVVTGQACQNGVCSGRYDMSGSQSSGWFESQDSFQVLFSTKTFSAFGFYATDLSDFGLSLSLDLLNADGSVAYRNLLVTQAKAPPLDPPPANGNGNLLFFGFTDTEQSYSGIRFNFRQTQTGEGIDVVGFDQLMIGDVASAPGGLPEPGSFALAGLALIGASYASRRKRSA